ncbi:MAG: hypothetical protein ABI693_02790 [Bryobacteraceae bacterium]
MPEDSPKRADIDRFIQDRVESVPHLEALLLLWRERPKNWSADTLTERLWVGPEAARAILRDLARENLIIAVADLEEYRYESDPEKDRLLSALSEFYRQDLVGISTMIHLKSSPAVREFARAFRLKKEQE